MEASPLKMIEANSAHHARLSKHADLGKLTKRDLIKSLEKGDEGKSLGISAEALNDLRAVYVKVLVGQRAYASLVPDQFQAIGDADALTIKIACCCCPCCCAAAVEPVRPTA